MFSRPSAANGDPEGSAAVISSGFVDRCGVFEGSAEPVWHSPLQSGSHNLFIDRYVKSLLATAGGLGWDDYYILVQNAGTGSGFVL